MSLWSINISQRETRAYNGIKTVSSINGVERTGLVRTKKKKRKKETRTPNYTIRQNKLKMDKRQM